MGNHMAEEKRAVKRSLIIWSVIAVIGVVFAITMFMALRSQETREKLMAIARRLLDKPVQLEMEGPDEKAMKVVVYPEEEPKDEIVVDNFDIGLTSGIAPGRKNTIGSFQGAFSKRPSYTVLTKSKVHRRGDSGKGLVIEFKKEAGWCGWYTLLNNVDITPYNTLSFWVKGEAGSEKFDIGLTDSRMQKLGIDGYVLGPVMNFIEDGFITKEWKEAKVPLARAASEIDMSAMGSLTFIFNYGGQGKIYVEDVKFKNDPDILKIEEYNAPRAIKDLLHPRSLWVWKIDPISNLRQRKELFKLCQRGNISILYQFFPEFTERPSDEYFASLAEFLREAHELEIEVEGLTGNPVWSLAENHHLLLNWIQFFLDYNKERPEEERLDGVSLDVEPYLTAEWNYDKERIKKEYIELLQKSKALVDSYEQHFRVGVAIPFFYDKEDDGGFERSILDNVDYLALMAYYDTAKYIIDKSRFHINLAKEANKRVAIGIETQDLIAMKQGKRRNTFIEEGLEAMERELEVVKQKFLLEPSFEGIAIHCYYSYRLMTRGRNVPTKERPDNYVFKAGTRELEITIDGKLDDWVLTDSYEVSEKEDVVYGGGAWGGPQDTSYKIYMLWDDQDLYFAADVVDDVVVVEKTGGDMWEGDHVEIWFDSDLIGDLTEAVNSEDDFQFGLSPGNFSNLEPEIHIWTPELPAGIRYKEITEIASLKKADGYVIEARFPKELLFYGQSAKEGDEDFLSLREGFRMGIMVDIGDTDDPEKPMKLLMSTSRGRIWGDPTTFGVVELE